jgi:hypothetical protein
MSTIAQLAKRIDLSERHTKTLIDSGVLKRAAHSKHDLDAQTILYIRHLRQVKQGIEGGGQSKLSDARARHAEARAESAERQNQQEAGDWVRVKEMIGWLTAECLLIREHFLAMPGKIADALGDADRVDCYTILHNEIWEALDAFANGEAAVDFIIEGVKQAGGKVSSAEAKALLEVLPMLFTDRDQVRESIRKTKAKGDSDAA